jgi:hypothetical protein
VTVALAPRPAAPMPSTVGQLRALFGRLPDDLLVGTHYTAHDANGRTRWPSAFWSPSQLDDAATWCTSHAGTHNV